MWNRLHLLRPIYGEYGFICRDVVLWMRRFSVPVGKITLSKFEFVEDLNSWGKTINEYQKHRVIKIWNDSKLSVWLTKFSLSYCWLNYGRLFLNVYLPVLEYIADTIDGFLFYSLQSRNLRQGRPLSALSWGSVQRWLQAMVLSLPSWKLQWPNGVKFLQTLLSGNLYGPFIIRTDHNW